MMCRGSGQRSIILSQSLFMCDNRDWVGSGQNGRWAALFLSATRRTAVVRTVVVGLRRPRKTPCVFSSLLSRPG